LDFFEISEKKSIFNTGSISYNVSLRPDIRQNYWKTHGRPTNNFKMVIEFVLEFFGLLLDLFG